MNATNRAMILYFGIAFLTQALMAEHPPGDAFAWFRWFGMSLLQGMISIKAYLSTPPSKPETPPGLDQALYGGGPPHE
ncbi:MAG: hypothetical protein E6Q97_35355 [Desulfurellales bacterium]|nr:MAG: hypothetical protein E6Q97_35355 [Desulfurellales bacterium]